MRRSPVSSALGRTTAILAPAYLLIIGGTYNGILNGSVQQLSLALLTLAAFCWLLVYLRRPLSNLSTPLDPALTLWAGAYVVSIAAHPSSRAGIGAWYAGLYAAIWFMLIDLRRRGLPARWLIDGALIAIVPLVLLAGLQVIVWLPDWIQLGVKVAFAPPRPPSTLGHPNIFATLLAMLFPLGMERLLTAKNRFKQVMWLLWIGGVGATLYLTYSRGGWLAAALGLTVLGFYHTHRIKPRQWWQERSSAFRSRLVLGTALFLLTFLVLGILSWSEFDTPRRGISSRFTYYRIATKTFEQHPVTGTGPFTFGLSILQERSIPPEQPQAHAHNLILNTAAELGLPGLLALAVTIYLILRWPGDRACRASLAAFGMHGLVDMTMITPAVLLLMIIILAAEMQIEPLRHRERIPKKWHTYQLIPLGLWIVVLGTGWWSARVYAAYLRGENLLEQGDYHQAAEILRDAVDQQPSLALYQAQYAYACGLAAYQGDTFCLEDGIRAYRQALDQEKPNAIWWANLAALEWQAGDQKQAVDAMLQAVRYAPKEADMWLALGAYEEGSGREDESRTAYQHAIKARSLWAYSQFWDQTAFRQDFLASITIKPQPYDAAAALWQAGQHDQAVAYLENWIDHDPTQTWPYVAFARLYLLASERDSTNRTGDLQKVQDYLNGAKALVVTDIDQAWIDYLEAKLAQSNGDSVTYTKYLREAQDIILPGVTGRTIAYGQNIAYLQFLRLSVKGVLLPQLPMIGPDPLLIDLLLTEK